MDDKQQLEENINAIRKKYLEVGFSEMTEAERIELILTYANRKKFMEYTKTCTERFKYMGDLMDNDNYFFINQMKMDQSAAILLQLIPHVSRIYHLQSETIKKLNSPEAAIRYFKSYFISMTVENVVVVCLDKNYNIVNDFIVSSGNAKEATVNCKEIFDIAIKNFSLKIILAHNHPQCDATPSMSDLSLTENFFKILSNLQIEMVDHIIIGIDSATSMRQKKSLRCFRRMPEDEYMKPKDNKNKSNSRKNFLTK